MSGPPSRAPLTVVKGAFTREDAPGRTQHGPGGKPAADRDLEWSILMAHAQDGDSGAYRRLLQEVTPYLRRSPHGGIVTRATPRMRCRTSC